MSAGLLERTGTSTITLDRPLLEAGSCAHIVAPTADKTGIELVMEARVYGYPVEALCGHRFTPQRDATKLPLCQECKEIVDERLSDESSDDVKQ